MTLQCTIVPVTPYQQNCSIVRCAQSGRAAIVDPGGEADRILRVKAAEGDAQSKALQGRGIADQRQAIVAGLRDSVDEFRKSVPGTTAKDVMNLVLMTQYFDMLKEIGASSRTNAILIPHSPGNLTSLTEQMRNAMIEADQTVSASQAPTDPRIRFVTPDESAPRQGPMRPLSPAIPGNGGHARSASRMYEPHE